ncbi:ABC transporter ATP-binding protein [Sulfitobacter mediterraneus]|uniref:Sugar ABC transporter ATPase n=1 Tax=Sulfitobacter mediterraneus TaxID=83219 RepID=A0A061SSF7_9RHOB|nr:ABC transporter ATP-binding protein [Sulfitobacter mediterraneus]KAJ02598.1 sugar ABC transporter ATPase [Sulfitobacter mediterraneus]MBM1311000.1 ABC transporter ATP-binding protein [Sulfitobacter mediterraneus]MBM1314883.1 ABC transporter ATP-binding protein [Sulfitobacter mediterraneus]MBM1323243.1 ABC transporter ATP-binding protein [Sulfitobacter mediterraneus]MBM1327155.1 ABC transporter ATP-binding protein [Sulfitobacter mediterraneus]
MAEIQILGVSKAYGGVPALDDVSLTLKDGSFTSIFGPPGSGKSVLLRLLLGLETVDAGQILIDGVDVTRALPSERNLGMVFQNLALFPQLTAYENIAFPLRRRNTDQAEIDKRIDGLTGVLNIGHILSKKPAALSGGERQRVAIGRALVRDAGAYLMDEPIAALDARLRDDMRLELKRLQSELGKTFIYVTHDCDEAMAVADQLAILNEGRFEQVGRPEDVYGDPATLAVAELVGAPRISVLPAIGDSDGMKFALGRLAGEKAKGECLMALRPEAVRLTPGGKGPCSAPVTDIERLGAFAIVTAGRDGAQVRAITDGDSPLQLGAEVEITVDPGGMLLFDPATGVRHA